MDGHVLSDCLDVELGVIRELYYSKLQSLKIPMCMKLGLGSTFLLARPLVSRK